MSIDFPYFSDISLVDAEKSTMPASIFWLADNIPSLACVQDRHIKLKYPDVNF
jgi:hypothetical protein